MVCNRETIDAIADEYEAPMVVFDGMDQALLGIVPPANGCPPRLAYSVGKIIEIIMSWGCSRDEAEEYYSFNIECLHIGDGTPVLVDGRCFNE